MEDSLDRVLTFWDSNPCQASLSYAEDRRQYFEEISRGRYGRREWHVPIIAAFATFQSKDVLEVGCGIATDGLEFARSGARYVGIDLTPRAIELARERFGLFGMPGRFEVANAEERLPFPEASFDHVYSFGVIHHSPHPDRIVQEIRRVLKPRGTFTVMLYNRTSVNYYIEIMFFRKLFRWLLVPAFMPRLISGLTGFDRWKLDGHREALIRRGAVSKQEWISMNTDGPFCPLAMVYSQDEAAELFSGFDEVRQEVWEFNVEHWPFIRRLIPERTARWIGRRWGWHRIITGRKVGG